MYYCIASYKDGVEAAGCIANDTQATGRRHQVKLAPGVGCLGVHADGSHRRGVLDGIVDGGGRQVASKLQKASLVRRAVVASVPTQHNLR